VYSNTGEDIKVGDIVSVEGMGECVVLSGNGGSLTNPQIKVRSLDQLSDSLVNSARLTLIRRDDDDEASDTEPLVRNLAEDLRKFDIQ
jgi:hypothetical protein